MVEKKSLKLSSEAVEISTSDPPNTHIVATMKPSRIYERDIESWTEEDHAAARENTKRLVEKYYDIREKKLADSIEMSKFKDAPKKRTKKNAKELHEPQPAPSKSGEAPPWEEGPSPAEASSTTGE